MKRLKRTALYVAIAAAIIVLHVDMAPQGALRKEPS